MRLLGVTIPLIVASLCGPTYSNRTKRGTVPVQERCYGKLGCIQITPAWYSLLQRPTNDWPMPRDYIKVKFHSYTRRNPIQSELLYFEQPSTIKQSNFNPKERTVFFNHGYMDTYSKAFVKVMIQRILEQGDYNVVILEYTRAILTTFSQACGNARLIGLELAALVNYLKDNEGLNPADVHIVGHSLGAQISGYAGEAIPGLGRITGLDPSGPWFQYMPTYVRLDPLDAEFVHVIHTDRSPSVATGFGTDEVTGHVDFYPNDGKREQPGCKPLERPIFLTMLQSGIEEAGRLVIVCSHDRAVKFFLDSINTDCPMIGIKCSSYGDFLEGNCFDCGEDGNDCLEMGFHATPPPPGVQEEQYYLKTSHQPPFCLHHYRILVKFGEEPQGQRGSVAGVLRISAQFADGNFLKLPLFEKSELYEHGQSKGSLFTSAKDIGTPVKFEVKWQSKTMLRLNVENLEFSWLNVPRYRHPRYQQTAKKISVTRKLFCTPSGEAILTSGSAAVFTVESCAN
ncbi:Triacylglycerol lipase [Nesidiocoris tenuis]|uniref:Triacylglycerol lipase n=1 Tax=Nesidiocoris tenuis TaxID=355587 RepID=A0ABN7BCR4_9HEMI|nr:Triacylglycerol lipase [Nesidiocoris tenuis]